MSAEVREAIASAVSTVEGITCSPYFVQSATPGVAFVRLDRIDYPNPFGGVAHWSVVLMLPGDYAAASKYLDEMVPPVVTAIEEHVVVTSVTPDFHTIGGGSIPVVLISGHREA